MPIQLFTSHKYFHLIIFLLFVLNWYCTCNNKWMFTPPPPYLTPFSHSISSLIVCNVLIWLCYFIAAIAYAYAFIYTLYMLSKTLSFFRPNQQQRWILPFYAHPLRVSLTTYSWNLYNFPCSPPFLPLLSTFSWLTSTMMLTSNLQNTFYEHFSFSVYILVWTYNLYL